jgi:hypothetical protein
MFARCLFCHAGLPGNETVAHFPHGRRIAFDPGRGRLWAVCDACRRWNLAPIEDRWEALEELEQVVRDRGRLLSQTDNIALIRAGELEVVRVGPATKLVEEAWWRYGRELRERRARHKKLSWIEVGVVISLSVTAGGAWLYFAGDGLSKIARWHRFGRLAWQGMAVCPNCGHRLTELRFAHTRRLIVVPDAQSGFALELLCTRCRYRDRSGRIRIDGVSAEHTLRRTLAWHHYAGASERRVREATSVIESAGSAEAFARRVAERTLTLERLDHRQNRTESIALEIALNDDAERRLLELELDQLEARWREEEQLAAIVDNELTPVPALERLRRMINPDARPPQSRAKDEPGPGL